MNRKVGALSLLLLSAETLSTNAGIFGFSHLNTTNLIPEWLPSCFETDNLATFSECLGDYVLDPTCLSDAENTYFTIAICASDALGFDILDPMVNFNPDDASFTDASTIFAFSTELRVCLDPLVPCINRTIESIIETFLEPTCLPDKLSNLTECARQNGVACQDTCRDAWAIEGGNPWEGLDENSVSTCNGIQSKVIDPFCEVLTCCKPCLQHYEELMECLVNEVLNNTGEVCDFECTVRDRRHLRPPAHTPSDKKIARKLEQVDLSCLQYAAGCSRANELAQYFLPCVATQFAEEIEAVTLDSSDTEGNMTHGGGTTDGTNNVRNDTMTDTTTNNTNAGDSDDNNNSSSNPTNNTTAGTNNTNTDGATAAEGTANTVVDDTTTEEIKGDDNNTSSAVTAVPVFWTQTFLLIVTTTGSLLVGLLL